MPVKAAEKPVPADPEDEALDSLIREIIGAERKIYFETPNSSTARSRAIREIIDRRVAGNK
jgi:hypothetical protein